MFVIINILGAEQRIDDQLQADDFSWHGHRPIFSKLPPCERLLELMSAQIVASLSPVAPTPAWHCMQASTSRGPAAAIIYECL